MRPKTSTGADRVAIDGPFARTICACSPRPVAARSPGWWRPPPSSLPRPGAEERLTLARDRPRRPRPSTPTSRFWSGPAISRCARWAPRAPRRCCSTRLEGRSSPPVTTSTRGPRWRSTPSATDRHGAGTSAARDRPPATTTTIPRARGVLHLFRRGGWRPWTRVLQLRHRHLARHRAEQRGADVSRFEPVSLAPVGPREPPCALHRRVLSPPALLVVAERPDRSRA